MQRSHQCKGLTSTKASSKGLTSAKVSPVQRSLAKGLISAKVSPVQKSLAKVSPVQRSLAKVSPVQRSLAKVSPVQRSLAKVSPVQRSLARSHQWHSEERYCKETVEQGGEDTPGFPEGALGQEEGRGQGLSDGDGQRKAPHPNGGRHGTRHPRGEVRFAKHWNKIVGKMREFFWIISLFDDISLE